MRIYYAYNPPYEEGENEPYNRSQGETQRRTFSQKGRIIPFGIYHNPASQRAGKTEKTLGFASLNNRKPIVRHPATVSNFPAPIAYLNFD